MRKITIIAFLAISLNVFAQDKAIDLKTVTKLYVTELKLDKNQSKQFKSILSNYKDVLYKKNIETKTFNAKLKLQTLEIYKILSKEQFETYLKLRSKHQPELSYKFQ
jgi:hypothetical protein